MLTVGDGTIRIEMQNDLAEIAEELLDRVVPGVRRALQAGVDELYERARAEWPVGREYRRRGLHSRDLLYRTVELRGRDTIVGIVGCSAEYARYIKGRKQGGKSTMQEVLFRPGRALARKIAREAGPELVR